MPYTKRINPAPAGGSSYGRVTVILNADQERLLAEICPLSTVMYFVRTVWEFMRLKSETGPPAKIHDPILRVLAVFLDGFEIMVTGAESKVAQTRPGAAGSPSGFVEGSEISRESWKLLVLAVPVT